MTYRKIEIELKGDFPYAKHGIQSLPLRTSFKVLSFLTYREIVNGEHLSKKYELIFGLTLVQTKYLLADVLYCSPRHDQPYQSFFISDHCLEKHKTFIQAIQKLLKFDGT